MWQWAKFYPRKPAGRSRRARPDILRKFYCDENGASIVMIALLLPALIGAMGLAAEVSYWRWLHQGMQNASDAAAIAAATTTGSNYTAIGQSVAAQYGYMNGSKSVTVSVQNPSTAPGCSSNCYVVTITDKVPLFLSQVVGYAGTNGEGTTTITATSVATSAESYPFCILALATSGVADGITSNGAPFANLNGCNVMSNTSAVCNGHNLNANFGDAHGTDNGCGITQNSNQPTVSDPYSGLATNIPPNTCGGNYPQKPSKKKDPPLPASNQWSGSESVNGTKVVCGDQQLTGNTTMNNTVLVIENGQLDTNGYTLEGQNLTIVFSGTNSGSYQHIPAGGGTLKIDASTSGDWSGVAIYQDPSLTNNVNISAAGNSPTWDISGLVYLPHSSVTLSGAVNKSASGAICFEMVIDNITINGTGDIFAHDNQCTLAGLNTLPEGGRRGMLVN
jgi:Flp pilus assembly protein TadG